MIIELLLLYWLQMYAGFMPNKDNVIVIVDYIVNFD